MLDMGIKREKSRIYMRDYRLKNQQKERERSRSRAALFRENNLDDTRKKEREYRRKWRAENRALARARERFYRYGVTEEWVERRLAVQNYCCAGCGMKFAADGCDVCIDHDHSKGHKNVHAARGCLCRACNTILGRVKDDPEMLRRLATYLEKAMQNA